MERRKLATATMFSVIHQSVVKMSRKMEGEIRRKNFVTPINYLELVSGYKELLAEKRKELGDAADKLANGLEKIDDTRVKVSAMGKELVVQSAEVAVFQKECEEFLVVIVQQKKEADEQQRSVAAKASKIEVEAKACGEMAAAAQADLDEALPALEDAVKALNSLNKGDISEIKAYTTPPKLVATVLEAVMILRHEKVSAFGTLKLALTLTPARAQSHTRACALTDILHFIHARALTRSFVLAHAHTRAHAHIAHSRLCTLRRPAIIRRAHSYRPTGQLQRNLLVHPTL